MSIGWNRIRSLLLAAARISDRVVNAAIATRLACESPGVVGRDRARGNEPSVSRARVSALGCQLWPAVSLIGGAMCAAGRSLPAMKLAFALMAAINGSTGSWVTLSHGL